VAIFVRQQVAVAKLVLPVGKIAALHTVLGAAMMLQPLAPEAVRDGQEEVVMIVVLGLEILHRLLDQPLVRRDLLRR